MKTSLIWGLLVIFIGILLLLNNFGITDYDIGEILSTYWPIIFIIWGLESLFDTKNKYKKSNIIWGLILLILGITIIARNLGYYRFDFSVIWNLLLPLLLIYIGINLFRGSKKSSQSHWAVLSGIEKKLEGKLKNTQYTAFMGGVELDISNADIAEGETILDLTAIMGGIDIKANPELNYILTNNTFLGGIEFFDNESGGVLLNKEFEHKGNDNTKKTIIINTRCILGGIEIH